MMQYELYYGDLGPSIININGKSIPMEPNEALSYLRAKNCIRVDTGVCWCIVEYWEEQKTGDKKNVFSKNRGSIV